MRLIDADECPCVLCEDIRNAHCTYEHRSCEKFCHWLNNTAYDVDKVVEELEKEKFEVPDCRFEYNNGWIPCSERMPEKTDDYLCQVGNWCMVLPYRKGQYAFLNKEGGPINVVAWQPLPELYKETGDKIIYE